MTRILLIYTDSYKLILSVG